MIDAVRIEILSCYDGKARCHPNLNRDIIQLLRRHNATTIAKIDALLSKLLELLDNNGSNAILYSNALEALRHYDGHYSLHITTGELNLRFVFVLDRNQTIVLLAFNEKANGAAKAKSYASNMPKAEERRKEMGL